MHRPCRTLPPRDYRGFPGLWRTRPCVDSTRRRRTTRCTGSLDRVAASGLSRPKVTRARTIMRLARKITLAIVAAIVAVMAAHAYFLLQRQVVLFDADLARSVRLKQALKASIAKVWEAYGDAAAQELVEHTIAGAFDGVRVRWT